MLANFGKNLWVAPMVWSPNSLYLAFVKVGSSANLELWRINVITGEQSFVTTGKAFQPNLFGVASLPVVTWSLDSTKITYTDYINNKDFSTSYQVDTSTGEVVSTMIEISPSMKLMISPLTSFQCGVSQFSQNDPQWSSSIMQTCGESIGYAGCAVTAASMVLRYYGVCDITCTAE